MCLLHSTKSVCINLLMHQYFVEYSVRLQKIIESLKLEAELEKSEENLRGTMIIMKPGESQ